MRHDMQLLVEFILIARQRGCQMCVVQCDLCCWRKEIPQTLGYVSSVFNHPPLPPLMFNPKVEWAAQFGSLVHPEILKMVPVKQKQLCQFPISALFRFTLYSLSSLRGAGRDTGARTRVNTHTHTLLPLTLPHLSSFIHGGGGVFLLFQKESQTREATRAQTTIKCYNMLSGWSN